MCDIFNHEYLHVQEMCMGQSQLLTYILNKKGNYYYCSLYLLQ